MTAPAPQAFRMSFDWRRRGKKYDDEDTGSPVPFLDAVYSFVFEYEGKFSMHLGDTEVEFDLELDLPIIYPYVPKALEAVVREDGLPQYLAFANQATALGVEMLRCDQRLTIKFGPIGEPAEYFRHFFDKEFHVSAAEFVSEWVRFISAVLDAIFEHDPSVKDDAEVKSYIELVEALRSAVKTGMVDPSALSGPAE